MSAMDNDAVIIHGKRISDLSPRHGRLDHDLWGVTRCNPKFWDGQLDDWTEWFDLHPLVRSGTFDGIAERRPNGWQWMLRQDGARPIWLQAPEYHDGDTCQAQRRFAMVPGAQSFPARMLQEHYRVNDNPETMFLCQVGWMMAYAAARDYKRIVLNGIGMQPSIASQHAHRDTLYWIGFCRGMGIEVVVEGDSTFQQPRKVYCFVRNVWTP